MAEHIKKMALKDIVFDETIYPRSGVDKELVETYMEAMRNGDHFPPLIIEEATNRILDGVHRFRAFKKAEIEQIEVELRVIPEGETAQYYSAKLNAKHGDRLTKGDLENVCVAMAKAFPDADAKGMQTKISRDLSVPDATVNRWIGQIYRKKKWQRDALIWELSLLGWSQEEIGKAVGLDHSTVHGILLEIPKWEKPTIEMLERDDVPTVAEKQDLPELLVWAVALNGKDDVARFDALGWPLKVYDVWNFSSCDDRFGAIYPGRIPAEIVANLLHYYTKPDDIVVDPMAGSGTTVDVSLVLGRRCYAFDIQPCERKDIIKGDFTKDISKAIGKSSLVFIDPPYWNMMDAKYPEGSISRLPLDEYYHVFERIAADCFTVMKSKSRIAVLIQNQTGQGKGGFKEDYLNHIFKLQDTFRTNGWIDERTISCPMPPDNKGGSNEASAKKDQRMLGLVRGLLIFRKP